MNQLPQLPQGAPRKTSTGGGCLLAVGAIGGLIALAIGIPLFVVSMRPKAERDKENASLEAEIEAGLELRAAEIRKRDDAIRVGCKLKPDASVTVVTDRELRDECHGMIREKINVPGSAEFPYEDTVTLTSNDGCNRTYTANYTAKNAFGVTVRSTATCTLDPRTGVVSMKPVN